MSATGTLINVATVVVGGTRHRHSTLISHNRSPKPARPGFSRAFLTASLLFCVGPMAILGSIQDGLTGDYTLLAIKARLDGPASCSPTR
jgi:hypothetical protein